MGKGHLGRVAAVVVVVGVVATGSVLAVRAAQTSSTAPLPLAATVDGAYLGPTAFATAFAGHEVCVARAGGHYCLRPAAVRLAYDRGYGTNRLVHVRVALVVSDEAAVPLSLALTAANSLFEVTVAGTGGFEADTAEGARAYASSSCGGAVHHDLAVLAGATRRFCVLVGLPGALLYQNERLSHLSVLQLAGAARWADHVAISTDSTADGDCANLTEDCPLIDSRPTTTPALAELTGDVGCVGGWLDLSCGSVIVRATTLMNLDGSRIPLPMVPTPRTVPGSQCTPDGAGTIWCSHLAPGRADGPLIVVLHLANTAPYPGTFSVEAPYADVQVGCDATGCGTYRAGPSRTTRCGATTARLAAGKTAATPCLQFDTPPGARLMSLGYLCVSRLTGLTRPSVLYSTRPAYGEDRFGNVPLSFGPS